MRHNPELQNTTGQGARATFMRARQAPKARAAEADADDDDDDDQDGDAGGERAEGDDDPEAEPDDLERQLTSLVERQVEGIRSELLESTMAAVTRSIGTLLRPDRTRLPVGAGGERRQARPARREPSRPLIRITPGEELLYRTLPKAQREFRKPETDHYIAEWIRGMAYKDDRRMRLAADHLNALERADTLEGTTTVTAGVGSGLSQGTGGALIPLPLATLIIRARDKASKLRALATKYTSPTLTMRAPNVGVATAAMAAEGAAAAQGEPTLAAKTFSKKKMQFNAEASAEMLEDTAYNLVSIYSERAGSAFGALTDVQICTSNGTAPNITESFASATVTAVTEAVAGTVGYADVLKLYYALPQQYRSGACWLATGDVLALLSAIRTTGGMPIFSQQSGYAAPVADDGPGSEGQIFRKEVYDVPMTAGELWFGNPEFYGILEGGGITAKTYDIPTADSTGFRFTTRWDGLMLLEAGFRQMEGLTTAGT